MLVNTEGQANQRLKELEKIKNKASVEHEEAKKNRNFTQMYPKGWQRVRELLKDKQGISAIQLYSFFEHIDPTCGAVVSDQQFSGKNGRLDKNYSSLVDVPKEKNALVRIPVAGKVCAYALDLTRCGKVMIHLRNMLLS